MEINEYILKQNFPTKSIKYLDGCKIMYRLKKITFIAEHFLKDT